MEDNFFFKINYLFSHIYINNSFLLKHYGHAWRVSSGCTLQTNRTRSVNVYYILLPKIVKCIICQCRVNFHIFPYLFIFLDKILLLFLRCFTIGFLIKFSHMTALANELYD